VTAINVKYLGEYRTEKLGRVKAMRFYLEYINHLGRLQKKSAHRRLQAGFTITEVLLAALMMLIAVLVAGIGLINLLRSNYRANADSEIRNNLNRTLEFVSDEVRRARIIAQTEAAIVTTKVSEARAAGSRAVLAFQIPNPDNPGEILPNQIVYYTKSPENSLTGLRVLWRFGPNLDANGNYITPDKIDTWIRSPVTDMLAAAAVDPNCPTNFNRIAVSPTSSVDGFFACVGEGGNQVILNANAQVKMTTNEEVRYSVSTRVFTRACQTFCLTSPTSPGYSMQSGAGGDPLTLPILSVPATVKAELINRDPCTFSKSDPKCGVVTAPDTDLYAQEPEGDFDSAVDAAVGDAIVVYVEGFRNVYEDPGQQTVDVYTSDTGLPSDIKISPFTNNQILFVFTTKKTPSTSYQILVTITPK
jgi:type II secretory pathway pseudopilin PulG